MKQIFTFFIIVIPILALKGQSDYTNTSSTARFIQNKGQWDARIAYRQNLHDGYFLIEKDRFDFVFMEKPAHVHEEGHAHDIEEAHKPLQGFAYQSVFVGTNPQVMVQTDDATQYPDYHNYYLGNEPQYWQHHVPIFARTIHKNLYQDIDMVTEIVDDLLKYTFYVKPQANTADIQIQYQGAEDVQIDAEGNLVIATPLATVREMKPFVYQYNASGEKIQIECNYVLNGKTVHFAFPNGYDAQKLLVIDPTIIFSTYTGSTQDNWGFTATYDNAGNAYSGGIIYMGGSVGASGYPTLGAFQASYQGGGRDATITKFNSTGTALIFSTYLGGNQDDQPHSMIVNGAGDLFVMGRTNSPNFPTVAGSYDQTHNGGFDIYVSKFSANGTFLGSTFIGGSLDDANNTASGLNYNYSDDARGEINLDTQGNVYVASCSNSTNFPTTAGAYSTTKTGLQDAVVFKLNGTLTTLLWSTYLGGSADDAAYGIRVDDNQNVYVTGGTGSGNFPITAGAVIGSAPGAVSGYVTRLNASGSAVIASTFIGTNSYDQSYLIDLDNNNNVYIAGQTLGNYPVINAPYSNTGGNQFVTKLDSNLTTYIYSTVFGNNSPQINISPTAFLVDICQNVYVVGWGGNVNNFASAGGNTNNLPLQNPQQNFTDGSDFYIIVFQPNVTGLLYASYFGGSAAEHVDGGTSRFDPNGVIYEAVCASCGGGINNFPTTPGVWSTTNQSTNCNLGLFKIDLDLSGMDANFDPVDINGNIITGATVGCAPLTVNFDNLTTGNNPATTTYSWDFGDNSPISNAFEPTHIYTSAGTYQVQLIINDPSGCITSDTVYKDIIVFPPPNVNAGPNLSVCAGGSVTLAGSGTGPTYSWSPSTGLSNPNIPNPVVTGTGIVTYYLTITDINGCTATDTTSVNFAGPVTVNAGNDVTICANSATPLTGSSSLTNPTIVWSPATGLSATNIFNPTATPTSSTTYTLTVTDANGCTGFDLVTITVNPQVIANAGGDTAVCSGAPVVLNGSTNITNPTIQWTPATGLSATNILTPTASTTQTTTYGLIISDNIGCADTDYVQITINSLIAVNAGNDATICGGFSHPLQVTTNANSPTFSWSPAGSLSSSTVANPIATPTQTTSYEVIVTDNLGCNNRDTVIVNVFYAIANSAPTSICIGDSTMLSVSTNAPSTYQWSPSTYLSDPTIQNPIAFPPVTTTYTVSIVANGCLDTAVSVLTVHPLPVVDAGENRTLCEGNSTVLNAQGAVSYLWSPSTGLSNATSPNPLATPTGNTTYYVVGTDANGCSNTDSVTIGINPVPSVSAGGPFYICDGDSIQLVATGANFYTWNENVTLSATNIPNPIAFPSQTQTYVITGSDFNDCASVATVTVNVTPIPVTAAAGDAEICKGFPVTLSAIGGLSYIWSTGDTTPVVSFYPEVSQTVYVTAYNGNCMGIPDSVNIIVNNDYPTAAFIATPDTGWAPMVVSFINQSQGAKTYSWIFNNIDSDTYNYSTEENPSGYYPRAGSFEAQLIAYSYHGCADTASRFIFAENVQLHVPSAFSPNNDSHNDKFTVGYYGIDQLTIRIYSRWGVLMYESNNKDFEWDGYYKGQQSPEGVYTYVIEALGFDKRLYPHKGTITLFR